MALANIDGAATQRRLTEIAEAGRQALQAQAQKSAERNAQAREAAEREKAHRKEVEERRAAALEKAAEAKDDKPEKPRPAPKAGTLSLGADEFREERQAMKAQEPEPTPPPAPAPPPEPKVEQPEPPRPSKTLKLGADEEDVDAPPKPRPRPPRPPRTEGDDDLSGRTWLR